MMAWLVWGACAVTVLAIIAAFAAASAAFVDPGWHRAFHDLACRVADSRGLRPGDLTLRESEALALLRARGAVPIADDATTTARTIEALIGSPLDDDRVRQLRIVPRRYLRHAITAQERMASRVLGVVLLSRLWPLHRFWCELRVRGAGAAWVARQAAPYWRRRSAATTSVSVLGALLATASWAVIGNPASSGTAALTWFGWWGAAAMIAAVSVPTVQISVRALSAASGASENSQRYWLLAVVTFAALAAAAAIRSGFPARWAEQLATLVPTHALASPPIPGFAVFGVLTSIVAVGCFRTARNTDLRWSERVGSSATGLIALTFVAFGTQVMLDLEVALSALVAIGLIVLGGLAWFLTAAIEWCLRWYRLVRSGVHVPRGTWRWWYLPAWLALVLSFDPVVTLLTGLPVISTNHVAAYLVAGALITAAMALPVIAVLMAVSLIRFVRRVDRAHRHVQAMHAASAHPTRYDHA